MENNETRLRDTIYMFFGVYIKLDAIIYGLYGISNNYIITVIVTKIYKFPLRASRLMALLSTLCGTGSSMYISLITFTHQ